jgi:hypothetical protein
MSVREYRIMREPSEEAALFAAKAAELRARHGL